MYRAHTPTHTHLHTCVCMQANQRHTQCTRRSREAAARQAGRQTEWGASNCAYAAWAAQSNGKRIMRKSLKCAYIKLLASKHMYLHKHTHTQTHRETCVACPFWQLQHAQCATANGVAAASSCDVCIEVATKSDFNSPHVFA